MNKRLKNMYVRPNPGGKKSLILQQYLKFATTLKFNPQLDLCAFQGVSKNFEFYKNI